MPPERAWTIQEYAARFRYTASLAELLTEADADRDFYGWFLKARRIDVTVRSAHQVQDDAELHLAYRLRKGNKGKLLAVAHEMKRLGLGPGGCVVVDRDDDGLAGAPSSHALMTDFASVEMYAFDARVLDNVIGRVCARSHALSGADLLSYMQPALVWVSACRRVFSSEVPAVALSSEWLGKMRTSASGISWDAREILGLSARCGASEIERLGRLVSAEVPTIESEPQVHIRGHDFTSLLLKVLTSRWARDRGLDLRGWTCEQLEGVLRLALEESYLLTFDLFRTLDERWR